MVCCCIPEPVVYIGFFDSYEIHDSYEEHYSIPDENLSTFIIYYKKLHYYYQIYSDCSITVSISLSRQYYQYDGITSFGVNHVARVEAYIEPCRSRFEAFKQSLLDNFKTAEQLKLECEQNNA